MLPSILPFLSKMVREEQGCLLDPHPVLLGQPLHLVAFQYLEVEKEAHKEDDDGEDEDSFAPFVLFFLGSDEFLLHRLGATPSSRPEPFKKAEHEECDKGGYYRVRNRIEEHVKNVFRLSLWRGRGRARNRRRASKSTEAAHTSEKM